MSSNSELLRQLRAVLLQLSSDDNSFRSRLVEKSEKFEYTYGYEKKLTHDYIDQISIMSKRLLELSDPELSSLSNEEEIDFVFSIINNDSNLDDVYRTVSLLQKILADIQKKLELRDAENSKKNTNDESPFLEYVPVENWPDKLALEKVLSDYLHKGRMIRECKGYENTNLGHLDTMTKGIAEFFKTENILNIDLPPNPEFDSSYIALAAPSLTGKTQAAFTINSSKVLYFVMLNSDNITVNINSETGNINATTQRIYKCFTGISKRLKQFINEDLKDLDRNSINSKYMDRNEEIPLRTFGFWYKLMELAQKFDSNESWLKGLSNLDSFRFFFMSLKEFKAKAPALGSFSVFLDEFSAEDWSVSCRNFARVAGIPCIVANTNAKIVNLVGSTRSNSRQELCNLVRVIVFTKLNDILPQAVTEIAHEIAYLKQRCTGFKDEKQKDELFSRFFEQALMKTRPGIVEFVIHHLKNLKRKISEFQGPLTLAAILQYIAHELRIELCVRKPTMRASASAMLAKVGLFYPSAYKMNDTNYKLDQIMKHRSFIHDHLYYIINPIQYEKDIFVTITPSTETEYIQIYRNYDTVNWTPQYTYFKIEEFYSILGSISIPFNSPVFHILSNGYIDLLSKPEHASDEPNLAALKKPSNMFKVKAALAIVDSTQHSHDNERKCSLRGQNGLHFFSNLVFNCINENAEFKTINLFIQDSALRGWIEAMSFPYLYSVNQPNADFQALADCGDSGAFISYYHRTADNEGIDGRFIFKLIGQESNIRAVVECKNLSGGLDITELDQILIRFQNQSARLGFIFCTFIKPPEKDNSNAISRCETGRINVFRVEKGTQDEMSDDKMINGFSIVQYSNLLPLCKSPKLIVIVLPIDYLNS